MSDRVAFPFGKGISKCLLSVDHDVHAPSQISPHYPFPLMVSMGMLFSSLDSYIGT